MDKGAEQAAEAGKLRRELAARDALIESLRALNTSLEGRNATLESTVIHHAEEIELLKRKLYGPRSERSGTNEMQRTLGEILADAERLQKELDGRTKKGTSDDEKAQSPDEPKKRGTPKGRRDLSASKLPQGTVELTDPALESQGKFLGFDESRQLMYRRCGFRVLVKKTAKYELPTSVGTTVLGVETLPS